VVVVVDELVVVVAGLVVVVVAGFVVLVDVEVDVEVEVDVDVDVDDVVVGSVPQVTDRVSVTWFEPKSVHVMSTTTLAVPPFRYEVAPEMSMLTSCVVLTPTTFVMVGAKPTLTLNVTGTGLSGKYLKCTVTASHEASTPDTMCADAGSAITAPTRTHSATAPASTLKRRFTDLRIFSLRGTRALRQCRSRELVRLVLAQREITRRKRGIEPTMRSLDLSARAGEEGQGDAVGRMRKVKGMPL
jgi:hypothetical protein